MVKLKRLKILKYRNVRPGTELRFDDGVNLVLGQNASGKTTLLALLSAVCRGDFSELEKEEYDLEAEAVVGQSTTVLRASRHREQPIARAATAINSQLWRVQLDLAPPVSAHHPIPVGWWRFDPDGPFVLPEVTTDLQSTFRFDESLGAFAATTGRSAELSAPAEPPPASFEQEDRGEDGLVGSFAYIPDAILKLLEHGAPGDPLFQRPLGRDDLELCREIASAMGFNEVTIEPIFQEEFVRGSDLEFKFEGFTFKLTRPDGTIIHHDRLSYGQKRLLAFYYYLACNPSIVIADELVNGLHHRWIETCMNALGDRQAFLTSQNPLLFDHVEFDSVEQVRSRFITCRLEQVDGREQMVWENMSQRDAEIFFVAYQADIEHVGDILITRGLW